MVDIIPRIATSAASQKKLLVHNLMRLYWPQLPAGRDREGGVSQTSSAFRAVITAGTQT